MRPSAHSLVNASWFSWFHSLRCLRGSMPVGKVTNHQILLSPYGAQAEREFPTGTGICARGKVQNEVFRREWDRSIPRDFL
jgi:hypothetical protein